MLFGGVGVSDLIGMGMDCSSLVDTAGYQYCEVAVGHAMVTRYVSEDLVTRSVSEVDRDAGRGG